MDNSVGVIGFVVVGVDWWNRRQLNTPVALSRAGRVDSSADHRSTSRGLDQDLMFPTERNYSKGEAMRYEDEAKGKGKQIAGTAKKHLGKLAGDRDLQGRGKQERFEGKVQEKVGKARRKVGEAVEDLGDRIAGKR